jgi:phosphoenolpyruvate synthase/pyruvate phosphate dikinase
MDNLQQCGSEVRHAILATPISHDLDDESLPLMQSSTARRRCLPDVAVRSSATAEDSPGASFAGQQETYLNVQGNASLLEHCRRSFASLFTDRAISYRVDKGFDHSLIALSIGVDRDSEIVAPIFDERNAAVKTMIEQVIRTCREKHRKIGICGQAPSGYPEFAQSFVERGIDSISLNPDTVLKTNMAILKRERRNGRDP